MTAKEKQSYGNTLLDLASKKRFSAGVFATTLCEEKEQLKERLLSIMKYKKKTAWAVMLSIVLVVCLSVCGVALGVVTDELRKDTDIIVSELDSDGDDLSDNAVVGEMISSDLSLNPGETDIHEAELDFDGDGLSDKVIVEEVSPYDLNPNQGERKFSLTVELGSGRKVVHEIPGWWWPVDYCTADFNSDGKTDIALMLGVGGSNYDGTNVYVYRFEGDQFVEYPKNIIRNDTISYDQSTYVELNDVNWISGGTVVTEGQKSMMRLRQLFDYDPGAGIATAYYTNLSWNGNGWFVESMEIGEAYGEEQPVPDTLQPAM